MHLKLIIIYLFFNFSYAQVELSFTEDALQTIAHSALERKTGARGLRAIMVIIIF